MERIDSTLERAMPYGIALLRISLGVMLVAHSVLLKYFVFTLPGTAQYFASIGLPGALAYVVFAMEAIGGIALILGIGTRAVSAAMIPILLGATWAHAGNGWVFSNPNGGWEYPLYLSVLAAAQVLLGAGAFALSGSLRHSATPQSDALHLARPPVRAQHARAA